MTMSATRRAAGSAVTALAGRGATQVGATVVVAASCLGAVLLAWLVVSQPTELLRLTPPTGPAGLGILFAGLGAAIVALRHPALGLYLLVAFVYLDLSQVLVRTYQSASLLQLLVVPLFLAAWAERDGRGLAAPRLPLGATVVLASFMLVALASTAWAGEPALAAAATAELAKALVIFCAVVALASSPARVRMAVMVAVAAGTLLAVMGLFQTVTGDFSNTFGGLARIKYAHIHGSVFEPRIAGPIGDPNYFAQILLPLVPLALALAWGTRDMRLRVAAYAAAAVLIAGTVLTYSRGAALALAVVLVLSLLAHGVRPRRLAVGLLLLLLLVPFAPDGFARRLTTISQVLPGSEDVLRPDSSFGKRRVVTGVAWRMYVDRPLLGVGAGNYSARFHDYVEEVGSAVREYEADEANYAHSLYLEIAAEKGTLGLAVFGLVLVVCFGSLRRARARFRNGGLEPCALLARGLEIGLVGYLISSIFLHGHHIRYLWLLFALAAALHAVSRGSAERRSPA